MSPVKVNAVTAGADLIGEIELSVRPKDGGVPSEQPDAVRDSAGPDLDDWSSIATGEGADGTLEAMFLDDGKMGGRNLLEDFPKATPKPTVGDLKSAESARDTLFQACSRIRDRYVGKSDIEARLKLCEDAVRALSEGTDAEKMRQLSMEKALAELKELAAETVAAREKVVRFVPAEKRKVQNLNASQQDRDAIALRDIREANVAIRNLAYDLKRTHGRYGGFGKASGFARQSMMTTRNRVARWFQNRLVGLKARLLGSKGRIAGGGLNEMQLLGLSRDVNQKITSAEIRAADAAYGRFVERLNAFAGTMEIPEAGIRRPAAEDGRSAKTDGPTQTALDDIATVSGALRTFSGGTQAFSRHIEQQLEDVFRKMKVSGSKVEFGLKLQGGVAVPVPIDGLDVKAAAEYEFTFKVYRKEADQFGVEICHAGGVNAGANFGINDKMRLHGEAEVVGGRGYGTVYTTAKGLAKELASGALGPLHLFFAKGQAVSVKSLLKTATPGPFAPKFDEGVFLHKVLERNLIDRNEALEGERPNEIVSSESTFTQISGFAGASGEADLGGVVSAKAGLELGVTRDVGATRTKYLSYFTYFTTDRIGEAGKTYRQLAGEKKPLVNKAVVDELLNRDVTAKSPPEDKQKLADDVLGELNEMIGREKRYVADIRGLEKPNRPSPETVCARYRLATVALVALLDKLRSVSGMPGSGTDWRPEAAFQEEFDRTVDTLRDNLQRPGLEMTRKQLIDGLYVTRSYADNKVVFHAHAVAEVNLTSAVTDNISTASPGGRFLGDAIGRVSSQLGLKSSAEFDVTFEIPEGDDKRPYRRHKQTTVDLHLGSNLPGKVIVALVQNAYRQTAEMPQSELSKQDLDAKSILKALFPGPRKALESFVRSKVTGFVSESLGELTDDLAEEALFHVVSSYGGGGSKTLSFQVEDGRLSAVGIGSRSYSVSQYHVTAGLAYFGTETKAGTVSLVETIYASPSFDSLMSLCDSFLGLGHETDFARFSLKHKHAFLRMATIAGGEDVSGDAKAADDLRRLEAMFSRMKGDVEKCPRAEQRERLLANFRDFAAAQVKLRALYGMPEEERSEQGVIAAVRQMLKAAACHYNILESD